MTSLHQYLDGDTPEQLDVARLWMIALLASEFKVLPTVVARELDEDPENLNLRCQQMLQYSAAKRAFDSGKEELMKPWSESKLMEQVEINTFAIRKKKVAEQNG